MSLSTENEPATANSSVEDEAHTDIHSVDDVLTARKMVRFRAIALGFNSPQVALLAAAISEVARNIIEHASAGEVIMRIVRAGSRRGLRMIARDRGPGIPDVANATQFGRLAFRGLGVGRDVPYPLGRQCEGQGLGGWLIEQAVPA